ncbi:MAG: pyridoxamine 5'-phosphate oxidase [Bdellovibrionota bacterium]
MGIKNPIKLFRNWYRASQKLGMRLPNAMTLATVSARGRPRARIVLLKDINEQGLSFFTNYTSPKSSEMRANKNAALVFFWEKLDRQIRVEGQVKQLSKKESDAYWKTRPRGSQIGAWASIQSRSLPNRATLIQRAAIIEKVFKGREIPRPPFWGGFILVPIQFEFWQGRPDRLHIRQQFAKRAGRWKMMLLYP